MRGDSAFEPWTFFVVPERLPHDTSSFAFTYTLAVARPLVVMPEVGSIRSAISSRPAVVFDSLPICIMIFSRWPVQPACPSIR